MLLYDATEMTISSRKKAENMLNAVGGVVFMRGKDAFEHKLTLEKGLEYVRDRHQAQGVSRSVGALWNSSFLVGKARGVLQRVYSMHKINAYTHHYAKYGIGKDSFEECFVELENAIRNYSEKA